MPVSINGFNIGTDASITISDAFGDVFPAGSFGLVTDFTIEGTDTMITVVPITNGGRPIFQTVWAGVNGTFALARINGLFQQMFNELMEGYHTQGLITQFSLTLDVLNRDGSVDEYLLHNLQWTRPRFGNFRATKEVDMSVGFSASQMVTQGAGTPLLAGLPLVAGFQPR